MELFFNQIYFTGIYFLKQDKNIVYVGQTTKGISRIAGHTDKIFDNIEILRVGIEIFYSDKLQTLNEIEQYYILKYQPKYNFQLPIIQDYIHINSIPSKIKKTEAFKQLKPALKKYYVRKDVLNIKVNRNLQFFKNYASNN